MSSSVETPKNLIKLDKNLRKPVPEHLKHKQHLPKIIKNRPGLATLKCTLCGRAWLHPYKDSAEYESLKRTIAFVRRPRKLFEAFVNRNKVAA